MSCMENDSVVIFEFPSMLFFPTDEFSDGVIKVPSVSHDSLIFKMIFT